MKFDDIVSIIQGKWSFRGSKEAVYIDTISKVGESDDYSLDWHGSKSLPRLMTQLTTSRASLTLVSLELENQLLQENINSNLLFVGDAKLEFARVFTESKRFGFDLTPRSFIETRIGRGFSKGSNCFIGDSTIGDNVTLGHNVVIHDKVVIGDNVVIGSNTVIGGEGYGYVKDLTGSLLKFPHIAGVIIGDNVEIGSNTAIDRGSLKDTVISEGVKIDNLVHIAHNVFVGSHTHIIANSMIAGSVQIGSGCWIAPSVNILEHLQIGDNATIGVGSVVTKNIPSEEVWTGSPARELKSFVNIQSKLKAL